MSKQQAKLRAYKKTKKLVEKELKESDKWVCIFTGQPIPDHIDFSGVCWHHLKGRTGDLIADKKFLRPYIDEKYHTGGEGYHNKPFSELKTLWWWNGFLSRVKEIDRDLWYYLKEK